MGNRVSSEDNRFDIIEGLHSMYKEHILRKRREEEDNSRNSPLNVPRKKCAVREERSLESLSDVLYTIFGYLDEESFVRAEFVSSTWKAAVSDAYTGKIWDKWLHKKITTSPLWEGLHKCFALNFKIAPSNPSYSKKLFFKIQHTIENYDFQPGLRAENGFLFVNSPTEVDGRIKNESKVLVLYTGGTIGMMSNENGALVPMANALERMIRQTIHLHDEGYAAARFGAGNTHKAPLALPSIGPDAKRIHYTIREYEPLLDSSNMTMDDWINIAKDLRIFYDKFDGFVILHGTDTLSYTASALSFMLENLGKTVIVTGSQIPIFETRSDGRDNFRGALIFAGTYCIPEVCVFFNHKLFRGNRTSKRSTRSLDTFWSPNLLPLAEFGISVHLDCKPVLRPSTIDIFRVHSDLRKVRIIICYPGITGADVRDLLHHSGIVLLTFGAGNVPNSLDLMEELSSATRRGVLIINITQCIEGAVEPTYETGAALMQAGVIPGYDMTPEAAFTKLSYVLSKDEWDLETKRQMMMTNLRGELTVPQTSPDMEHIEALALSLHLSSSEEMNKLKHVLFPSLICSAVKADDLKKLQALEKYGASLSASDIDGRTPLHVAASEGLMTVVKFLLGRGVSVRSEDRLGNTPLMSAVTGDHHEVIAVLVECGAHLTIGPHTIGEMLCSAAAKGNVKRLVSLMKAGADLNQPDISNRTALHLAAHHNQEPCVTFLLKNNVALDRKDDHGFTAGDMAQKFGHENLIRLITSREGSLL